MYKKKFVLFLLLLSLISISWATGILDNPSQRDEQILQIGDGTVTNSRLPIELYYNYSYSQSIYLVENFEEASFPIGISKIAYHYNGNSFFDVNFDLYYGYTDANSFSSGSDWVVFDSLTQVYSGTTNFPDEDGWVEIQLTSPIYFDGTRNLVLAVDNNTGSYGSSGDDFYATSQSDNKSLVIYTDGTNYNPENPPSGNVKSYLPNTKFYYRAFLSDDLAVKAIDVAEDFYHAGESVSFDVLVKNSGQNSNSSNITVNLGENQIYAGNVSLEESEETTISIEYVIPLDFIVGNNNVVVTLDIEDENLENNVLQKEFYVYERFKLAESFEKNILPLNWQIQGDYSATANSYYGEIALQCENGTVVFTPEVSVNNGDVLTFWTNSVDDVSLFFDNEPESLSLSSLESSNGFTKRSCYFSESKTGKLKFIFSNQGVIDNVVGVDLNVPVNGELYLSEIRLNDLMEGNEGEFVNIKFSNMGQSDITITELSLTDQNNFQIENIPELPLTLAYNDESSFDIKFTPTMTGLVDSISVESSLSFNVNGVNESKTISAKVWPSIGNTIENPKQITFVNDLFYTHYNFLAVYDNNIAYNGYNGKDFVYNFTIENQSRNVSIYLEQTEVDNVLLLYSSDNLNFPLFYGINSIENHSLIPGDYYIVVEGGESCENYRLNMVIDDALQNSFYVVAEQTEIGGLFSEYVFNFSVANNGLENDNYAIEINNSNNSWTTNVQRVERHQITTGEQVDFVCTVTPPEDVQLLDSNEIELIVTSQNTGNQNTLSLKATYIQLDNQESNDVKNDAFLLEEDVYFANIYPVGDVDWYKVYLQEDMNVKIYSTKPDYSEVDTKVWLFKENDSSPFSYDNDSNENLCFRKEFIVETTGWYYFRVAFYNNSQYDDELVSRKQELRANNVGYYNFHIEISSFSLSKNSFNLGTINIPELNTLVVNEVTITNDININLNIDNVEVTSDRIVLEETYQDIILPGNESQTIGFTIASNVAVGSYVDSLKIYIDSSTEVNIPITYEIVNFNDINEPNNLESEAVSINYGYDSSENIIYPYNDVDYYKFVAEANETVKIETILPEDENDFDIKFTVSKSNRRSAKDFATLDVNQNGVGLGEEKIILIEEAGTYLIKVENVNSSGSSNYRLKLTQILEPVISCNVETLNLGDYYIYGDVPNVDVVVVSILNSGSLDITGIEIMGEDAESFSYSPLNLPVSVDNENPVSIEINFSSFNLGLNEAVLNITLGNGEVLSVSLIGKGSLNNFAFKENFNNWPDIQFSESGTKQWKYHDSSSSVYANFWSYYNGQTCIFESEAISLTDDVEISFDWSHKFSASYPDDGLIVSYSFDNGENWTEIFNKDDSDLNSQDGAGNTSPGTFTNFSYNLEVENPSEMKLQFKAISGYGPNLYIDNVKIKNKGNYFYNPVVVKEFNNPMEITIEEYTLPGVDTDLEDQIEVYDGELLLLSFIPELITGQYKFIVPEDNPQTEEHDGYVSGNPIIIRYKSILDESLLLFGEFDGENISYLTNGNVVIPNVNFKMHKEQNLNLQEGWNLVSFNVGEENCSVYSLFEPVMSSLHKILDENLNPIEILPFIGLIDQIGDYSFEEGYKVKARENIDLSVIQKTINLPLSINLNQGFNIISYPCQNPQASLEITDGSITGGFFAEIANNNILDKVVSESGNIITYIPYTGWINQIGNLEPGKAYYVVANLDTTLEVNEGSRSQIQLSPQLIVNSHYNFPIDGNPYSTMWISLDINELEFDNGDEIAVYDGDLCVGYGYNKNNGKLLIKAYSDDLTTEEIDGYISGNDICLRMWDNSENEEISLNYTFLNEIDSFVDFKISAVKIKQLTSNEVNPKITALYGNYPNPFNPKTMINFSLNKSSNVKLEIYNLKGQKIKTLVNSKLNPDNYFIEWNGSDNSGLNVASGVYFYRLETDDYKAVKKMIMLK